jgi:hypothetical protein
MTNPVRKGREIESRAVRHLEAGGYVVHRCVRNGVLRKGKWYSAGNDIWGCVDLLAKRRGERIRFIQVTCDNGIAAKRHQLGAVPWDREWECVEIWRWIPARGRLPSHFQRYLLDEDYRLDHSNRVFPHT